MVFDGYVLTKASGWSVFYRCFCCYHRSQLSAPTRSERRDCHSAARPHFQDRQQHIRKRYSPTVDRASSRDSPGPRHPVCKSHCFALLCLPGDAWQAVAEPLPGPSALRHICRHFLATLHSVLLRLYIPTVAFLSSNVRRSSSHLVTQSTAPPPSASSFSCPSRLCRMSTVSGEGYPSNWLVLVAGSSCCWYRLTRLYVAVYGHASGLSELSYNHVGLAMHVMIPLDKAVHL